MSAMEELRKHAREMTEAAGITVNLVEEGTKIFVVLAQVHLPGKAFRLDVTDMLFQTDQMYPLSAMDMFWTELEVVRADGTVPQGAETVEQYLSRPWRRFSWHRNGIWNPTGNPLLDHYAFAESRLAAEVRR